MEEKIRCPWCLKDKLYMDYHDLEWGRPVYDSRRLFEKLCLDGAQAGLSWYTILKKRENYRLAFDQFDAEKMARYDDHKRAELLANAGIVRNKLKINAFIVNAQKYLEILEETGSFSDYLWQFTGHQVIDNTLRSMADYRPTSPESDRMSRKLKKRGFKFVGSTICYAFMQAAGLVNDHLISCFVRREWDKQQ